MLYCYVPVDFEPIPARAAVLASPSFQLGRITPVRVIHFSSLLIASSRGTRYRSLFLVSFYTILVNSFLYHIGVFKKTVYFFSYFGDRLQIFDYLASRPVSSGPAVEAKMRPLSWAFALAALAQGAQALELLKNEAMILYSDVSPKLRVITKSSAFKGGVKAEPCPCASRSLCIYIYARGARAYFKHYRR